MTTGFPLLISWIVHVCVRLVTYWCVYLLCYTAPKFPCKFIRTIQNYLMFWYSFLNQPLFILKHRSSILNDGLLLIAALWRGLIFSLSSNLELADVINASRVVFCGAVDWRPNWFTHKVPHCLDVILFHRNKVTCTQSVSYSAQPLHNTNSDTEIKNIHYYYYD